MSYNGIEKYNWVYGADGRIGLHNDLVNDVTWRYEYTKDGALTSAYGTNGERFDYTYEPSTGKLLTATVSDGTTSKTTTYNYSDHTNGEDANLIESVVLPTATVTYDYDGFYRASYDVEVNGSDILTTDYTFLDGIGENSTTTLVESMTTSGSDWSETLSYTYDCKGNIETISENSTQKAKYYYDDLNQLVREDNAWTNKTVVYTYDNGGNIQLIENYTLTSASDLSALIASSTDIYAYIDSNGKDKLTSYNGNTITYDEIGNPLTYYNGYEFDWQNGRQLVSVSASDLSVSYKYDSSGIRTEKTVNGVTTTYTLEGSNIVKEANGTDTIWYYYDASGSLTGFELNGTPYFYVKNVQGDIVAITNASGNIVVEYSYDSWGKLISISGSHAGPLGTKNHFLYRGYYYDYELSLYYLNSRYYDPITKRFINADGYISTGVGFVGNNMFAYCNNVPISCVDSFGLWTIGIPFSVGFGFGIGASFNVTYVFDDNLNFDAQISYAVPGVNDTTSIIAASAGFSVGIQYTNADTVYDLYGSSTNFGASFGGGWSIGFDLISFSDASEKGNIDGFQLSIGKGVGLDVHVTESYTQHAPDLIKPILKKIYFLYYKENSDIIKSRRNSSKTYSTFSKVQSELL